MFQEPQDRSYLVDVDAGVLRLSFNRPEAGNAIPPQNVPLLTQLFQEAQSSKDIRAILIRGEGRIFSAGGDVAAFGRSLEQDKATRQADYERRLNVTRVLIEAISAFDRPIVTSVRGAAAGAGLFYSLIADYAIGDETATFVFAHQRLGLTPDAGLTTVLPQIVGVRMARSLLLTAAKVDAQEALRLGMLNRIVAADQLEDEAMKMARRLAQAPQLAAVTAKRLINDAQHRSLGEKLDAETAGIVACVGDDDFVEGVRAFLEKRTPIYPSARER